MMSTNEEASSPEGVAPIDGRERSARTQTRPRPVPSPTLEALLKTYKNKKRPKEPEKTLAKTIISLWQGHDGGIAKCELCYPGDRCIDQANHMTPVSTDTLTIHHADDNPSNNDINNLFIAHHPCNSSEYQRAHFKGASALAANPTLESVSVSEGAARPAEQTIEGIVAELYKNELERHDKLRFKWNCWINDLENGAFKGGSSGRYSSALATTARGAIGTGNKVTFARYIEEDVAAGILEEHEDEEGRKYLTYLGKQTTSRYHPVGAKAGPPPVDSLEFALAYLKKMKEKHQKESSA